MKIFYWLVITTFIILGWLIGWVYAEDETVTPISSTTQQQADNPSSNATNTANANGTATKTTTVIVTEDIPGANCTCIGTQSTDGLTWPPRQNYCWDPATRKYRCEVKSGFASFQEILAAMIKWIVFISALLGVLSLAVLGVMWSLSGADSEKTKKVKWYFINILVGLTILFFFRYILAFLAPWIYK